ncbi:chloride conductance regulatory protein icln [Anaeramoeba flamelloides]|uniref:Chloride conductance regulatory protein icln n=1 Tax=Anaeramoeba flamelloides TaxID=1746091 RepID=A0ABQ8XY22_9EUKA|nr:chloride conductance regulatory protein icln [Anaeramoeba flamelloides]
MVIILPEIKDKKPVLLLEETILLELDQIEMYIVDASYSSGTLYVTSRRVIWISDSNKGSYSISCRSIVIHGVSRPDENEKSSFPSCIVCQIENESELEPFCSIENNYVTVRFIPTNEDSLQEMYKAFSKAAELNPDPKNREDESSLSDNEYENENENDEQQVMLPKDAFENFMKKLEVNGQFEDPEEEDDEKN